MTREFTEDEPRHEFRKDQLSRVIAIDGPAGSGKSTVARAVANALGAGFLDTGALYRAVALAALEAGADISDGRALGEVARRADIAIVGDRVTLNGEDVSEAIRTPEVTAIVSEVSAHPEVRTALIAMQRVLAAQGDVVLEGRDIGTEVVPDADLKVFLTASLEERARRRCRQERGECNDSDVRAFMESLAARDRADTQRAVSPLRMAADAHEIDSSDMSLDEVVAEIVALVGSGDRSR
jgi:CMP/dCMP kinase